MKCPICGQELRPGKKDPNYLLCYNCKNKFKIPQSAHKVQKIEKSRSLKSRSIRIYRRKRYVKKRE